MGYTHYWRTKRDFTESEWRKIRSRTTSYLGTVQNLVAGPHGDGYPIVDNESISFNGIGIEDSHESFHLQRERNGRDSWVSHSSYLEDGEFNFCKTALKPYDESVVAVLLLAKDVAPECIDLSSDGGVEVFQ